MFFQIGGSVLSLWDRERLAEDSGVELGNGYGGITLAHNVGSRGRGRGDRAGGRAPARRIARAPGETFWGGYSAVFVDLDGYPWEVAHNPHWELGARQRHAARVSSAVARAAPPSARCARPRRQRRRAARGRPCLK